MNGLVGGTLFVEGMGPGPLKELAKNILSIEHDSVYMTEFAESAKSSSLQQMFVVSFANFFGH